MHHALNWLWQGFIVALATFVALQALYRARPHARCVLCWAAVIATLMLPLLPLIPEWPSSAGAAVTPLSPAAAVPLAMPQAWWTSTAIMLLAWAGWAGVYAARVANAVRRLNDARGRSRPFPADLEARLACWMAVRARGRRVRLVVADDVGAAAVLGCGAPLIAVSPRLLERLDVGEIDRVVIHEWAHVQRRDDLLQLADAAVRVTAGWHPAIYWLLRQLSLEREAACDAVAVDVTGCPRRYAASLAAVASARSKPRRLAIAAGVLSAPPLRVRIMRILSMQQLASAKLSATAVAAGILVIGVLASEMAARPLIHAPATAIFDMNPLPDARHAEPVASPVERATTRTASPRPRVARRAARERVATAATATLDTSVPVDTPPGSAPSHAELVRDDAGEPVPASAPSDPVYETAAGLEPEDSWPLMAPPANDNAPAVAPLVSTAGRAVTAPWVLASNAAVAVARGSGKAATATSGFFTRAGRRLASTF